MGQLLASIHRLTLEDVLCLDRAVLSAASLSLEGHGDASSQRSRCNEVVSAWSVSAAAPVRRVGSGQERQ
jgi:hypothetical protein